MIKFENTDNILLKTLRKREKIKSQSETQFVQETERIIYYKCIHMEYDVTHLRNTYIMLKIKKKFGVRFNNFAENLAVTF